ncbi:MAG: signal peptidase II [Ignavibacteriaceae bacterium]
MRVFFVSFAVILIDQISKLIVKGISIPFFKIHFPGMNGGQRISVVDGLFNITFVENPGIAFGIYPGDNIKFLICLFTLAVSILICYYLYKNRSGSLILRLSLALIVGGAMGNLIDRVFYGIIYGYGGIFHGKVVDFFNLKFFDIFIFNKIFGDYVFNIADMAVTFGVILFLLSLDKKKSAENEPCVEVENYLADDKK